MATYLCSRGHRVRADGSQVSIDSLCGYCRRIERYTRLRDNRPPPVADAQAARGAEQES